MGRKTVVKISENQEENNALAEVLKPEKKETIRKIYLGPSLKGVQQGTVFLNGLSPALEEAIRKTPVVAELVVPVSSIRTTNCQLADPDSAISRFYHVVENNSQEGE